MPDRAIVDFVPLHCHSYYSLLDGLDSPERIAETAAMLGNRAVALTDHGSCGGLFAFQKACDSMNRCPKCGNFFASKDSKCPKCKNTDTEKSPVKPILGIETYFVDNMSSRSKDERKYHLTLLAKDQNGYKNLIKLSTLAYTSGFYSKPRIDADLLSSHKEGIMALSACAGGIICAPILDNDNDKAVTTASRFKDIFGGDFYIEIMDHIYNPDQAENQAAVMGAMEKAYQIGSQLGIKCVYTYDSHYCRKEDAGTHEVVLCISSKDTMKNKKRKLSFGSTDFYMKPWEEIKARVVDKGRGEIVLNTLEVAGKVSGGIITPSKTLLPKFILPPGVASEEEFLKNLIRNGMIRNGIYNKRIYRERIAEELEVIIKCGFVSYFLVLWDFISYARREGIRVGPGRGSGVASLCLYCLGVTALDPIKYDLLFSRFLNPDRVSPPDVDIDFDFLKQDKMFNYASEKYGAECVTRIGTYGSLKARDAIKRVGKAMDIGCDWETSQRSEGEWKSGKKTLELVDSISKSVPFGPEMTIEKAVRESDETRHYSEQYPEVFKVARKVEGSLSNSGVHPAGVVLCNQPVSNIVPLRSTNDVVCTQFDMHEVEEMGLLKFDFLALKTLSIVEHCLTLIKKRHGKTVDVDLLDPVDKEVFKIFNDRDIDGIFQFEGHGISQLLLDLVVDSFDDLIVGVALFRPGPMDNIPDFCAYKHKMKPIEYVHPIMKDLLHSTYGMMVYQEQVMAVSMKMAGFTPVQADKFRKGMGKKDTAIVESLKSKFISGCEINKVPRNVAETVFALCGKFAGYGFNKSHAAAYAYLAYQTAFLKCYYRPEFMCALLTFSSSSQDEDKRVKYEKNAKNHDIRIMPCDINKSGAEYEIEQDGDGVALRRPLNAIKGIGEKAVQSVVRSRPYSGFRDFLAKVDGQSVNTAVFETLVDAGCMKCWKISADELKRDFAKTKEVVKKAKKASEYLKGFEGSLLDV